ncbi:unnamed protein product [Gadus morhua 'NCC']
MCSAAGLTSDRCAARPAKDTDPDSSAHHTPHRDLSLVSTEPEDQLPGAGERPPECWARHEGLLIAAPPPTPLASTHLNTPPVGDQIHASKPLSLEYHSTRWREGLGGLGQLTEGMRREEVCGPPPLWCSLSLEWYGPCCIVTVLAVMLRSVL